MLSYLPARHSSTSPVFMNSIMAMKSKLFVKINANEDPCVYRFEPVHTDSLLTLSYEHKQGRVVSIFAFGFWSNYRIGRPLEKATRYRQTFASDQLLAGSRYDWLALC